MLASREEAPMKRIIQAIAAVALTLMLASPVQADPVDRNVKWVCVVEGEPVTFVAAPEAALHGITQANATAGHVFHDLFGEDCHVESP
jgi:hypothetical protein